MGTEKHDKGSALNESLKSFISCTKNSYFQFSSEIRFIESASCYRRLRLLFKLYQPFIIFPEIHNAFFERIYRLKNDNKTFAQTTRLETLRTEIENIVAADFSKDENETQIIYQ